MRPTISVVSALLLSLLVLPTCAFAWDCFYDGSVLPTDPSLGTAKWEVFSGNDSSMCSSDGNLLHVVDASSDASAYFSRFAAPSSAPVTAEAKVRVASGSAGLSIRTSTYATHVSLFVDHIDVTFFPGTAVTYSADMSGFRTLRVATSAQGHSYVWLDGELLCQGLTSSGLQGGLMFGSISYAGLSESYWDYVAYSNAFLPVPEPSALVALLAGLGGFGFTLRRRR